MPALPADNDPEDAFEDSLLTLFAHHPIAFSTPAPDVPYLYTPPAPPYAPLALHLPTAPSALHTALQLTHIWLSSVLLADLVYTGAIPVRGRAVAELGAGAGLPGVAAVMCGAEYVVATDYDVRAERERGGGLAVGEAAPPDSAAHAKDVLDVLRDNYVDATAGTDAREGTAWSVTGHTWATPVEALLRLLPPGSPGQADAPPTPRRFQTLLLADLLWSSSSHSALITSVRALLAPCSPPPPSAPAPAGASAHVAAGLHHGRHAVRRFQAEWIARGGWVRTRREVRWAWSDRARGESSWEEVVRRPGETGARAAAREDESPDEDEDPEANRGVVVWFEIGFDESGGE